MGTWYAPAGAGQRPCVLSQTDGSLQGDPGLCVGVEAGRGQGEDTHLQQGLPDWVVWPFCSSGVCGRVLGPPLTEFLASTEVVLNLGYMLESPGEVLKKKKSGCPDSISDQLHQDLGEKGWDSVLAFLKLLS